MKTILTQLILVIFIGSSAVFAQTSISEKTSGMELHEGYFNFWWDATEGKIWLEIDKPGQEVLYVNSMAAGMGSNDIGLDRGQLGDTRIVVFDRVGPKVLLRQPNYDYRASSDNWLERKSVDEAFAQSVLWGFTVAAEEDGRILIDATDFLLRDAHGVAETLRRSNQGNFSVDKSRSAIYMPATFNFPKNTEFEATITFTGSGAGGWVRSVTPSSDAITVRLHHSLIELPDDNYKPRKTDPRSGFFGISYQDYSAPIGGDFVQQFIARHRLEKKDPSAAVSEAVEPIVYYLDNGTPEPVRSALLDGGRWWSQAFEAIGYKDAFRVEVLPADAHPMDVRYNVIQWIHRSTRGWSYGSSVTDPRTGEIIKGHVSLGSLRVRQDFLIAEGLLGPYADGSEPDNRMIEMALARIRQLSAHEIGHTLGIAHNFASSVNDRASVMDYPHPKVIVNSDGSFDLSEAYDTEIGEWDIQAIKYGYQDFPDNVNEDEALQTILKETIDNGLLYISDRDARAQGGAHPDAHLWEYGTDHVAQMTHILDVRKKTLDRFSENMIREGVPMASLHDVLVPMYLFHRYQTEATVKLIGGVNYNYNSRGDGQSGPVAVNPTLQRSAIDAMMATLSASTLALPQHILDIIPPQPTGISISREQFRGYTEPTL
ncbi:MAG TPA: peptidase, partial [Bacteroidetes bacterium]|nr:peptidase [Bacteroidota bacterium]